MKKLSVLFAIWALVLTACSHVPVGHPALDALPGVTLKEEPAVKLGVEVLFDEEFDLIKGKKVALITNSTGVDSKLRATADLLHAHPDVDLVALFGPEHGIRGGVQGAIDDATDPQTGVQVYSLYGKIRQPTAEMLEGVDVLLFDIQDIGSRSYTYISTMKVCMDSAAENKVKFVVLDRPNPINGEVVDGNILTDENFRSFIGIGPICYVHGMTVGELAQFFNKEMNVNCDLHVVKMKGWKRDMTWTDTGLLWVPTSPHIPEWDSSMYYPVTGILGELPLVNIGVGYTLPFKLIGAPWIDGYELAAELNSKNLPGVYFRPFFYKPYYFHYEKEACNGIRIVITDHLTFQPAAIDYHIIAALTKLYPDEFNVDGEKAAKRKGAFDRANGTDTYRELLGKGEPAEKIIESYQADIKKFRVQRLPYLLYK